jgi:hypothetical protein
MTWDTLSNESLIHLRGSTCLVVCDEATDLTLLRLEDLTSLQAFLGHKTITITAKYAQ